MSCHSGYIHALAFLVYSPWLADGEYNRLFLYLVLKAGKATACIGMEIQSHHLILFDCRRGQEDPIFVIVLEP